MIVDLPDTPMTISTGCITRNLDPLIVDLPYTHMTISIGCQIVHLDHQNAKVLSSKFNPFGLCEIEWFP